MVKNKAIFTILTVILCLSIFAQSCLCDTKVNSSIGLMDKVESAIDGSLDYDNYNEALVAAYLKAVYDKDVREISKAEIAEQVDNIFVVKDKKYSTKNIADILENMDVDRELKNKIDHNYYGEISTLAAIKSKGFYVSQNNEKYYNIPYSGTSMHVTGCGPISLSIALNMLSDKSIYDGETLALWSKDHGYMDANSGTIWAFIKDYAQQQGFDVTDTAIGSVDDLDKYFKEGAVIVTCMNRSVFTDEGHFIVLAGLDSENNVQVVDPISIYRTNKNWPAETMLKNSKGTFWVIKR